MSSLGTDWIERSRRVELRVRNFVNGRWQEVGGEPLDKYGPRDGKLLCRYGAGAARDAHDAVANARLAFEDGRWSRLSLQRRKEVLGAFVTLIVKHREELALLECLDAGKPISDTLNLDVPIAAATIKHDAEAADQVFGKVFAANSTNLSYQLRRPWGVVAAIVGWNFPLVLAARKIGAALVTGNCLVLKPSELTSLSTARLAELAVEAGVPEGVFNVIHGDAKVGAALALNRDVKLLTFTGSTATGKKLLIAAGESNMKRLILECGGKAPNIVFDDVPDLEAVAAHVTARAFWNQGQVCTASSRLLIQESIKDEFLPLLIRRVSELKPGDPLNIETRFGAVVSREHKHKVLGYIDSGEREGARKLHQSSSAVPFDDGFYVPPTVFDQVSREHSIAQEEIFGPVLSVMTFRDEEQAIQIANDTVYGLSAILWTKDLGRAHRVTHRIDSGWIAVNATPKPAGGPVSGVISAGGHKESGMGVEGGVEGLEAFTSQTAVQLFV